MSSRAPVDLTDRLTSALVTAHVSQNRVVMPVSIGIGLIVLLFFAPGIAPPSLLLAWWTAHTALCAWRMLRIRRFLRADDPLRAAQMNRPWLVAEATLAGLLWGLLGTLLYPTAASGLQPVAAMLLMGVSASALVSLSPLLPAYFGFFGAMLLPNIVAFALRESYLEHLIAVTFFLFTISLVLNGRRVHRNLLDSLRLQFELADTASEAQLARREADAASEAKSHFLATVSHEIRTPMNGMLGMAQILERSQLDAAQRSHLETLTSSGKHLLRLIDDMLDLSRIEAGKLSLQPAPIQPTRVIDQVHKLLSPRALAAGLEFATGIDSDVPDWVLCDDYRLRQVLINLVSNAIKNTPSGRVKLTASVEREPDRPAVLLFAVTDSGTGIPEEAQRDIFEAFTQLDSGNARQQGGAGLGLSICRKLSLLMDGEMRVHSVPNEGSTFSLAIPLQQARAPLGEAPQAAADSGAGERILLVEDSPTNRLVASLALEHLGYSCDEAEDGSVALERLRASPYAAVLMDCQLPGIDGLEATRRWRQIEASERRLRTPIIALTANAVIGDAESCLAAGMDDYLAKPLDINLLGERLQRWIPAVPDTAAAGGVTGS